MSIGDEGAAARTWRDLSALQIILWTLAIVFMLQYLLAGGFESSGDGLLGLLPVSGLSVWAAGAVAPRGMLEGGEWWRVFSAMFLHFSLIHVAVNAMGILSLGRIAEEVYGRSRVILVFLGCGLAGNLAPLLVHLYGDQGFTVTAGASGALCGFLGLLLAHMRGRKDAVAQVYARQLLIWTVVMVFWSMSPGISFSGHAGGFLAGYVLGRTLPSGHFSHLQSGWRRWIWPRGALAASLLALCVLIYGGVGAKERLAEVRYAERLGEGLFEASRQASSDAPFYDQVRQTVRATEAPSSLAPIRQQTLEALADGESSDFEKNLEILQCFERLRSWWRTHAPDLPMRYIIR